jgi:anti-sigma regulatory factor (Ser/Thr protein kinase)
MMAGVVERRFTAVPTTPALIRAMVTDAARTTDLHPGVLADIRLAVTEAATNAVKHAYPDGHDGSVDVTIESDASSLRVVVRDYGIGFQTHATSGGPGLGLPILAECTQSLAVDRCDTGTRVVMTFRL